MSLVTRPRVLVSSTIYDFQDLRSALRYWLSELGYDVLLSEFNDFPKGLDENSYQSCLNAISRADYFILLIGNRNGGWYKQSERVSITRMEYRQALDSFQRTRKPKLLIFVRQSLWDIREDREALERQLKSEHEASDEISKDTAERLVNHSSRIVNDAKTTFEFLQEVGRVQEMKNAAKGSAEFPRANWIHRFTAFADIVDALHNALGVSSDLDRKILVENLKQELLRNLCQLLCKLGTGGLLPISQWAQSTMDKIVGGTQDRSQISVGEINRILIFMVTSCGVANRLTSTFIEQAVRSGVFMTFDTNSATYKLTKAHNLLLDLIGLISDAQRATTVAAQAMTAFCEKIDTKGRDRNEVLSVRNFDLILPCSEAKRLGRITQVTTALARWLNGDPTFMEAVGPWSLSAIPDETSRLQEERVDVDQVTEWLNKLGQSHSMRAKPVSGT
jgi:Domain of unknown function (DUF4062)